MEVWSSSFVLERISSKCSIKHLISVSSAAFTAVFHLIWNKASSFFIISGLIVISSLGGIFSVLRALSKKVLCLFARSIMSVASRKVFFKLSKSTFSEVVVLVCKLVAWLLIGAMYWVSRPSPSSSLSCSLEAGVFVSGATGEVTSSSTLSSGSSDSLSLCQRTCSVCNALVEARFALDLFDVGIFLALLYEAFETSFLGVRTR